MALIYRSDPARGERMERLFALLVAVAVPTVTLTFVNTVILYYIYGFGRANAAFMFYLIPRLVRRVLTVFYDVYILMAILTVYEKFFKGRGAAVRHQDGA
jgi:hypothetical protein